MTHLTSSGLLMNNQAADSLATALAGSFGNWHEYSTFYCCSCGNRLVVPVYCGNRFCDVCGGRRRARVRKRLDYMVKNTPHPAFHSLKALTLTVKSTPDLSAQIKLLQDSFTRLRARLWWKQRVVGGAYVIEVTHTEAGWHVHIHAILMAKFLPHSKLKALWKKVSGSSVVWISGLKNEAAITYLTKYLTKSETATAFEGELRRAFKGVRMFQPFGQWQMLRDKSAVATCLCNSCGGGSWMLLEHPEHRLIASTRMGQVTPRASPDQDPPSV